MNTGKTFSYINSEQFLKQKYRCFSGTEDDNVPSADSLNDLDQIEEVDEGLDEAPDNDDDEENDDNVSDYEPQSGGIMSRHSDPKSLIIPSWKSKSCIYNLGVSQISDYSSMWHKVSLVFEDFKFEISEGQDKNFSFYVSALLAV